MVGWYDPGQLINTGIQVIISQILGARADYRLIESFSGPQEVFDFSQGQECWFDFLADLGDGWDATYTLARLLAAERLRVQPPPQAKGRGPGRKSSPPLLANATRESSAAQELPRGRFLIMGGDQVYPVASRDQYQERMVAPYEAALPRSDDPHPELFAIPGNHDWYDGLISFMRLFAGHGWIGGWRTRQKRSYFAIKLPHDWWVWALDYQLESDIDQPQLDYFNHVADQMPANAKVVLVSAEPDWIYGHIYHSRYKKNIEFLQTSIIEQRAQAKLRVALAGDLHHYRRHEAGDGSGGQLITSGGGGAFLLGTTGPKVAEIEFGAADRKFQLKSEYPDRRTSSRLLLRNLLFPLINPKFGIVTGLLYLVIAWIYRVPVMREYDALLQRNDPINNAVVIVRTILGSPFGFGVLALVVVGFIAFTDTHERIFKYLAGASHASANLAALFVVSAAAAKIARDFLHLPDQSIRYLLASATLIFLGGYFAGAIIMGVYLYISHALFRRHSQEAYSSLRIADYKHFLRLHVNADGELTIYPIGVDRVGRGTHAEPTLIEPPIRVK